MKRFLNLSICVKKKLKLSILRMMTSYGIALIIDTILYNRHALFLLILISMMFRTYMIFVLPQINNNVHFTSHTICILNLATQLCESC